MAGGEEGGGEAGEEAEEAAAVSTPVAVLVCRTSKWTWSLAPTLPGGGTAQNLKWHMV